jgi:hypothetical protein
MQGGSIAAVAALLAAGAPALAFAAEAAPVAAPVPERAPAARRVDAGPFLGDRYRWAEMPLLQRIAFDVIAIPANVPGWSAGDFAQLALWTGAGVALSAPGNPPADVRLERWFRDRAGPGPLVWSGAMQGALWGTIAVGAFGTWGWAAATGRHDVAQGLSLMGEALAVTQVYHVSAKLLIGRSGPTDGDGRGAFGGPANAVRVYPAGMPSGHAATLYSLLSAGTAYFEPPGWVTIGLHALVGGVVAFHVIDHRHFASESLWGAAVGWYTGQWVVRHRASYRFADAPSRRRLEVVPFTVRAGGGLALRARL